MRNLLFVGVIVGGLAALVVNLLPPRKPAHITHYDTTAYQDSEFRDVVLRLDASFQQDWLSSGFKPAETAPDLVQARRVALGLMGTVPSLEEIRQFEALSADQRMPWFIDHILADARYHDYLAERLARAYVGIEAGPFVFFRRHRFVTWLEEQVAKNRPYDQVVHDVIATEGLWTDRPAANFISVTAQQEKGNAPNPVRLAGRVTRAFLGLRLDCAECHNHPFAQWKQTDFQGFSAFFGQTHIGFTGVRDGDGEYEVEDKKTQLTKTVAPRVPFAPELLPEQGSRRERLATWVTHPKNPYFAKATVNRMWALLFGRPLVTPVDNLEPDGPVPPALQILADDFVAHHYDLRRLIRVIASSRVFRLESATVHEVGESEDRAWAMFPLTRLRPEQVAGSVLQSASITTLNGDTHIVVRLIRQGQQSQFVQRYGDTGEDEFDNRGGTIPQRLLLMNGEMVRDRIKAGPATATGLIAGLAPDDPKAVEVAYLAVLSRRPTPDEAAYFETSLKEKNLDRGQHLEDLYWALINSTEFSWNH
jgi:Protein of unknown function (DUF1549)/Protein of unknown function (DUF1553)